jgi:NADPH:quinone reductase-like Zn-dependent oxidoreductase
VKAIVYTEYGSPDVLRLEEVDKPAPKDHEVLIKIHAASINSWDWDLLRGDSFLTRLLGGMRKPRRPILGADIAGRVEAVGRNVQEFRLGDEVFGDIAGSGFGGFAEYVSVPEKLLARKSPTMTFEQAAALPQAGLLALQGLRYKDTPIRPGQQVLINGAGGGVGTLALQYARMEGAEVTCVDRAEKFDLLRSLGADHLIDYTKEDYTRSGRQYDRILDVIAHRSVWDYRRALKPGGTFAMIGGSMGGLLLQLLLLGPMFSRFGNRKLGLMGYKPNRNDLDYLSQLFEEGKVVPVIDKGYLLSEVAEAFRYFGTGLVKGKLVISVVRDADA